MPRTTIFALLSYLFGSTASDRFFDAEEQNEINHDQNRNPQFSDLPHPLSGV